MTRIFILRWSLLSIVISVYPNLQVALSFIMLCWAPRIKFSLNKEEQGHHYPMRKQFQFPRQARKGLPWIIDVNVYEWTMQRIWTRTPNFIIVKFKSWLFTNKYWINITKCHVILKVSFMVFVSSFRLKQETQTLHQDHIMFLYYLLLCSYSYISGPFSMRWALVLTAQDSQTDNM